MSIKSKLTNYVAKGLIGLNLLVGCGAPIKGNFKVGTPVYSVNSEAAETRIPGYPDSTKTLKQIVGKDGVYTFELKENYSILSNRADSLNLRNKIQGEENVITGEYNSKKITQSGKKSTAWYNQGVLGKSWFRVLTFAGLAGLTAYIYDQNNQPDKNDSSDEMIWDSGEEGRTGGSR